MAVLIIQAIDSDIVIQSPIKLREKTTAVDSTKKVEVSPIAK
jgi:hypothetical protein